MEKRTQSKKRKLLPAMLAVILAAVMIVPVGGLARAAGEADEPAVGTFTTKVQDAEDAYGTFGSDLLEKNDDGSGKYAEVAYYRIAKGKKDTSYDTYNWELVDALSADKDNQNLLTLALEGKKTSEGEDAYEALAKKATETILKGGIEPSARAAFGNATDALPAGLYLAVPVKTGEAPAADEKNSGNVTVTTDEWVYTFAPMLYSMPTKVKEDGSRGTASDFGSWIPNETTTTVEIITKAGRDFNYGKIAIEKTLLTYETKDNPIFVYDVVAKKNGETVYSNVVSISFTGPGQKTVEVDKLPIGATVTVTEVYTGHSYELKTGDNPQDVIAAAEVTGDNTAKFSNDYDHTFHGGGGIENRFTKPDEATSFTVDPVSSKSE